MAEKSKMSQKEKDAQKFAKEVAEQRQVELGNNPDGSPLERIEEVDDTPVDTSPFKAQFGRTKNLLRYEQIAAANKDRNAVGKGLGAAGVAIGDAISATDRGPEDEEIEVEDLPKYEKQFDPNSVDYIGDEDEDEEDLDAILAGNEVEDDEDDIPIVPTNTILKDLVIDLNEPAMVNPDFFQFDPIIARSDTQVPTHIDPTRTRETRPDLYPNQNVPNQGEAIPREQGLFGTPVQRRVDKFLEKQKGGTPFYRQGKGISSAPLYRYDNGGIGPDAESRVHNDPERRGRNPYKKNFTTEDMYGKSPLPRMREGALEEAAEKRKARKTPGRSSRYGGFDTRFTPMKKRGLGRRTPFFRLSLETPFHQEDLEDSGFIQRGQALSYLGDEGAAATEGYNHAVDRHNYKQKVWNKQKEEYDETFGDLVSEPTGNSAFDQSQMRLLREKKKMFADLHRQKQKGTISANDFADKAQGIRQAITNQAGMKKNLDALLQDYAKDKDNISASTKPETIDALNALYEGSDNFELQDVEGIETMVGTTPGGKQVFIPVSDLASGKNAFRYNKQVDTTGSVNKIAMDLGKLEQDLILSSGGVRRGSLPWSKLEGSARTQISSLLENDATVRAVAAEKLGIDYDDFERRKANGEDMKELVVGEMLDDVREVHEPYGSQFQLKSNPIVSQQLKVEANRRSNERVQRGPASERNYNETKTFINEHILAKPISYENLEALEGAGINEVQENEKTGLLRVYYGKKDKFIDIDPANEQDAKRRLSGVLGLKPGDVANIQ